MKKYYQQKIENKKCNRVDHEMEKKIRKKQLLPVEQRIPAVNKYVDCADRNGIWLASLIVAASNEKTKN